MTLSQVFTVLAVFGGFGFLIWSRLVKRNHPIVHKVHEWTRKKKQIPELIYSDKWQQTNEFSNGRNKLFILHRIAKDCRTGVENAARFEHFMNLGNYVFLIFQQV